MRKTVLLLLWISTLIFAQLSVKNQSELTYWETDENWILENWLEAGYQVADLEFGLRLDIFNPPANYIYDVTRLREEMDNYHPGYWFAAYHADSWSIRLGHQYETFGRGLVLRAYENRDLRVDNSFRGGASTLEMEGVTVKLLAGQMRDKYQQFDSWSYGGDVEWRLAESIALGGSILHNPDSEQWNGPAWAARANYIVDVIDLYAEYAGLGESNARALYGAAVLGLEDMTLTVEYKEYRDYLLAHTDSDAVYNTGPAVVRQHSYTLLNRHPLELNMADEKGWQFEYSYFAIEDLEITLNYARSNHLSGKKVYEEYYAEVHHYWNDFEWIGAVALQYDKSGSKYFTPLLDVQYNLDERNLLHLIVQHQHNYNFDKSEYDTESFTFEYTHSPDYSLALVTEYSNSDQVLASVDRSWWTYGLLTWNFMDNQQLSLLYGSRQAGYVCVGGVCRLEPEFEGLEIKLNLRY
jgi:hypothetical protein